MYPEWRDLTPEVTLRPQQLDALDRVWQAFEGGAEVVLLEAPTGVGKSLVEVALCRAWGSNSYVVTPQRALQDQLAVWDGLRVMKGRNAYRCNLTGGTAAGAPCLQGPGIREEHECCSDSQCPYFSALHDAVESGCTVHNYASLMAQSNIGGHFGERGLLALDECHTAAGWIRNYFTLELTDEMLSELAGDWPSEPSGFMTHLRVVMSRLEGVPRGLSEQLVTQLLKVFCNASTYGVEPGLQDLHHSDGIEEDYAEWATRRLADQPGKPWHSERLQEGWRCTPVRVAPYANVLTGLGERVLLVSATVLNARLLLSELGLAGRKWAQVTLDSAFPAANRPVVRSYAARMSYGDAEATDRVVERACELADRHDGERGIVHTVSHRLSVEASERLQDRMPRRNVVMLPQGARRDQIIRGFLSGELGEDAVLVGPSMLEGIDGLYDACRWQAMLKAPWPHRADPVATHLMDSPDPATRRWGSAWYSWKAAQATVQGIGRVCRADDDHGVTYLLDGSFERILRSGYVPEYVLEAVR